MAPHRQCNASHRLVTCELALDDRPVPGDYRHGRDPGARGQVPSELDRCSRGPPVAGCERVNEDPTPHPGGYLVAGQVDGAARQRVALPLVSTEAWDTL